MRPRVRLAAAVSVLALAAGACSAESITERVVEEAAEAAGGGELDIDLDEDGGGVMSIETSEGSMQMGGSELPESFPADLPLPEGDYEVTGSLEISEDDGTQVQTTLLLAGDVDALGDYFEQALADAGWDEVEGSRIDMGELTSVNISATKVDVTVLVSISSVDDISSTGEPEVRVGYVVTPDASQGAS